MLLMLERTLRATNIHFNYRFTGLWFIANESLLSSEDTTHSSNHKRPTEIQSIMLQSNVPYIPALHLFELFERQDKQGSITASVHSAQEREHKNKSLTTKMQSDATSCKSYLCHKWINILQYLVFMWSLAVLVSAVQKQKRGIDGDQVVVEMVWSDHAQQKRKKLWTNSQIMYWEQLTVVYSS